MTLFLMFFLACDNTDYNAKCLELSASDLRKGKNYEADKKFHMKRCSDNKCAKQVVKYWDSCKSQMIRTMGWYEGLVFSCAASGADILNNDCSHIE